MISKAGLEAANERAGYRDKLQELERLSRHEYGHLAVLSAIEKRLLVD